MDIIFIVLTYNIYQETVNCVDSIKENIDTDEYHVIVVDNASPNAAGKLLEKHFDNDKHVTVLINNDNLGFANGNNLGIQYARKNFAVKYICCLNNDTLLEKRDFFSQVDKCYVEEHSALIGPKIILKNGRVQALMGNLLSVEEYQRQLKWFKANKSWIGYIKNALLDFTVMRKLNDYRHRILEKRRYDQNKLILNPNKMHKDIILHGSCLIFTPKFFSKASGFNNKTFMFREEELLFLILQNNNLHNVYNPNIEIRHLEDVSTDSVFAKKTIKNKFLSDNQIKSLQVLIDEMSHC